MQWTYLVTQSWTMAIIVGIGAFLLGLLVSRKGGSSLFSSVVFFLPNLFLDMLDTVHTKKFKYYGLILALLSIEAFFAFRAATVYYDVLQARMPAAEMAIVSIIVFVAVFLCGYMVATHGKLTFWSFLTMVFVVVHDWAGTVYMNYAQIANTSTTNAAPDDSLKLMLTIGMCVLGLLPFIMGAWVNALYPELEAEMEQEVNAFTSMAERKIKRRAVDRVLRLANHTNVVQLVRALPADEFADFKAFVMPIIAPGLSHNLPNLEEQPDNLTDKMTDASLPIVSQPTGQNGSQPTGTMATNNQPNGSLATGQNAGFSPDKVANNNRQNDSQNGDSITGKMATSQPAKRQSSTGQNGSQNGNFTSGQNGDQEPASKTALRDEKIRQCAAKYPKMTHAKLASKFKVSERTVSRALASQEPSALLENAETRPSTNGHKNHEPNTDEMEAIVISEIELSNSSQLN